MSHLNIMNMERSYISNVKNYSGWGNINMPEGRLAAVTGLRSASGIKYVQTVFKALKANMSVTVKDNITAVCEGRFFQPVKRAVHTENVSVGSKYLMLHDRQGEYIMAEAAIVAVSCNVYYLRRKDFVAEYESVELTLAVTKMKYPVGVGITHDNAFKSAVVSMGVGHNNNTQDDPSLIYDIQLYHKSSSYAIYLYKEMLWRVI